MVGTIILSIIVILAIISFIFACNNNDDGFIVLGFVLSLIACIILTVMLVGPREYVDECVVNTKQDPLKVVYIQYHPFTANTCDDVVILPGQSKLLHNVRIAEKITYKFDPMCK